MLFVKYSEKMCPLNIIQCLKKMWFLWLLSFEQLRLDRRGEERDLWGSSYPERWWDLCPWRSAGLSCTKPWLLLLARGLWGGMGWSSLCLWGAHVPDPLFSGMAVFHDLSMLRYWFMLLTAGWLGKNKQHWLKLRDCYQFLMEMWDVEQGNK